MSNQDLKIKFHQTVKKECYLFIIFEDLFQFLCTKVIDIKLNWIMHFLAARFANLY
jgi:hypothetical protein